MRDFPVIRIFPSKKRGINKNRKILKLVNGNSSNLKAGKLVIILPMKSPIETVKKAIGTNKSFWKAEAFELREFTDSVTETMAGKIVKLTKPTKNKDKFDVQSFLIKPTESKAGFCDDVFNGSNEFDKHCSCSSS